MILEPKNQAFCHSRAGGNPDYTVNMNHEDKRRRSQGGFTLVELVMGMLISGIILMAVATLSFAMGRGQEVTDLMIANQSMMRTLSIRLPELIRNGLIVWMADDGDLVIWAADANGNRQIETSELTWLIANTPGQGMLQHPVFYAGISICHCEVSIARRNRQPGLPGDRPHPRRCIGLDPGWCAGRRG